MYNYFFAIGLITPTIDSPQFSFSQNDDVFKGAVFLFICDLDSNFTALLDMIHYSSNDCVTNKKNLQYTFENICRRNILRRLSVSELVGSGAYELGDWYTKDDTEGKNEKPEVSPNRRDMVSIDIRQLVQAFGSRKKLISA